jgi:Tfp pilus assembly PilM family ATPase
LAKRVKVPLNIPERQEAEHIHWELENSVITPLQEYVYLKTDTVHNRNNFKEVFIIALRKNIVEFFQKLVDFIKLKLTNLSANHLSAEICLKNAFSDNHGKTNLLYRISQNRLESICLINGNVYMSNYEKIKSTSSNSSNDIFLKSITEYVKFVENYFEQIQETSTTIDHIYLYGSELGEELIELIKNNTSVPVSTLNPVSNLNLSPEVNKLVENSNNLTGFVECIGVALDAD